MRTIRAFINRLFHRTPKPARQFEYLPLSALPDDVAELVRGGVVAPWRVDPDNQPWFVGEVGAVAWWRDSLGGETDDA